MSDLSAATEKDDPMPRHAKMYKVSKRIKKVDSMALPDVSKP